MSVLKEKYQNLTFPLDYNTLDSKGVLKAYFDEFNLNQEKISAHQFFIVYTNMLRDYLDGKIESRILEAISLKIVFQPREDHKIKLYNYLKKKHPLFAELASETIDVGWAEEASENFQEYRDWLVSRFNELLRSEIML